MSNSHKGFLAIRVLLCQAPVLIAILLFLLSTVNSAEALTLKWIGRDGGLWSSSTNWISIDDGSTDVTAVISYTSDLTVIIDTNVTLGGAIFGNSQASLKLSMDENVTLTLLGTERLTFLNTQLTNRGTVNWNYGGYNFSGTNAQIENFGLWNAQSNGSMSGVVFNNYGTFEKSGGDVSTEPYVLELGPDCTFNNRGGAVLVQLGDLFVDNGIGSGTFSNAVFTETSWTGSLTGDSTFAGGGIFCGSIAGSNAVLHGVENFTSGTLSGTVTLADGNLLNLRSLDPISFTGVRLTNYGIVNWRNPGGWDIIGNDATVENFGTWTVYDPANLAATTFDNYGLWDLKTNTTFSGLVFNNYGTVRKSDGSFLIGGVGWDNTCAFNNSGIVDVQVGDLELMAGSCGGTFNIATNAELDLGLTLTGDVNFAGGGNLSSIGQSIYGSNAVIHGCENFTGQVGCGFSGAITFASNNVFNIALYPICFINLSLTNYGTVNWLQQDRGDNTISGQSAWIVNCGSWDAAGNGVMSGVTFNNWGIFRKSGGAAGDAGQATILDNTSVFNNAGLVEVDVGQIDCNGACSLTNGSLNFAISSAQDYGNIAFSNSVGLAGTLSVILKNGFVPAMSNAFALVTYPSASGTFSAVKLPHVSSSLTWQTSYDPSALTLTVIPLAPPQLTPVAAQDGNSIAFEWYATSDQSYQVQWTTNLVSADWFDLGDIISNTNGMITLSDPFDQPQKFYRLTLLP